MKYSNLFIILCLLSFAFCFPYLKKELNGDNIKISRTETQEGFTFTASFNKVKSPKVQAYIDEYLKPMGNFSMKNVEIDATITLDDKSNFYLKTTPGELKIKVEKEETSASNYFKLKRMCESLSDVIAKK